MSLSSFALRNKPIVTTGVAILIAAGLGWRSEPAPSALVETPGPPPPKPVTPDKLETFVLTCEEKDA